MGGSMRTFLRLALSFIAGFVVAYVIVVAISFWYVEANNVASQSGGTAMAIMFAIGPLGGLIGGTVCAVAIPIWLNRRDLRRGITDATRPRMSQGKRVLLAIALTGIPLYLVAQYFISLHTGPTYATYWAAVAAGQAPLILAAAGAALAAYLAMRSGRTPT